MGLWRLASTGGHYGRSVVGLACCVFVLGPVILIVGGALLASALSGVAEGATVYRVVTFTGVAPVATALVWQTESA
jgi:hypothetical protein